MYMLSFARIVFFVFFCVIGMGDVLALSLPSCDGVAAITHGTCASSSVAKCYVNGVCHKIESCQTCSGGKTIINKTYMNVCLYNECGTTTPTPSLPLPDLPSVDACVCICESWDWRDDATEKGYQSRQTCTCDESTNYKCVENKEYRCAKGYYGTATSVPSGCTPCPGAGTTSGAGKTKKADCYISADQILTDDIGTYTFGNQCNAK